MEEYREYRNTCSNCRHATKHGDEEPCKTCMAMEGNEIPPFNKWEAKQK